MFFSWQQQTPGFLNLLKVKTTLHNGMDRCTRKLGDMLPGWCLLTRYHSPVNILSKAWVMLASFIQVTTFNIRICLLQIKEEFLRNPLMKNKKNCFSITGNKDFISCFHCGLTISDWQEMSCALQQHSRLSPKCIYLRHTKENWKILRDGWAKSDMLTGSWSLNKIFSILKWSVFKTSLANIWVNH